MAPPEENRVKETQNSKLKPNTNVAWPYVIIKETQNSK